MTDESVIVMDGPPAYGRTPRTLLRNPTISAQAKALWSLLEDFASPGSPQPFPGQATLAGFMGVSDRSIRTWLHELRDAGWLGIVSEPTNKGRRNVYRLHWKQASVTQDRKPASGGDRKYTSGGDRKLASAEEEPVEEEPVEEETSSQSDSRPEPPEWGEERNRPQQVPTKLGEWNTVLRLKSEGNKYWREHPELSPIGRRCASRIATTLTWGTIVDSRVAFFAAWDDEIASRRAA